MKPGKYYERLVNLNKELGGGILIHQVTNDSITAEDLITQVAQGKIPYTVADNDVAKLNATYYPNLNTSLSISLTNALPGPYVKIVRNWQQQQTNGINRI